MHLYLRALRLTFWARHHARELRCMALEGLKKERAAAGILININLTDMTHNSNIISILINRIITIIKYIPSYALYDMNYSLRSSVDIVHSMFPIPLHSLSVCSPYSRHSLYSLHSPYSPYTLHSL